MSAPLPHDEAARLIALHSCRILDTPPEPAFERIANLASQILAMPIAAVSFVDQDRQWHKAIVGAPVREIARQSSFCAHAILNDGVFVVPDTNADPRFADNPYVVGEPNIRFYAGVPVHAPDGQPLGTLCVLDHQPRQLDEHQRQILSDLAELVVDALSLRAEITARQQAETTLHLQHQALKEVNESVETHVAQRTIELSEVNLALHSEIRQRKLADHERRRSEHRFHQLFNQASDAAFVHDMEGRVVDVNAAACASLGYTRAELLGMGIPDIEMTHDPAEGFQFWRELPVGSVEQFEGCHRRKDGSTFPVEIHVSVLESVDGRHLMALIRDITERKGTEKLLRTRACEQEAVARLGTRALSSGSMDELLQEAVALVADTLGIERCRVHEHLPEHGLFVVRASLDPTGADLGEVVTDDSTASPSGHVLHTGKVVIIDDVDAEQRFKIPRGLREHGAKCAACVLIGGQNPGDPRFGVLGASTRQRRVFTQDDQFFLQSMANVLAAAITRRRNEDDLRTVEARYQRIIQNTPGVVYQYLLRADGTVAVPFISESCRLLYRREPYEIQGNPQLMLDSVHPDDQAEFMTAFQAAKHTLIPLHWQGRHLLPDGEVRWMRVDSKPERLPDGGVICDGIIIDITEQKQRQQELRQSEERFRLAILHSPFPIMLHASDGEVVQVNHAWTGLTGYPAEELRTTEDWITRACPAESEQAEVRASITDFLNRMGTLERPGRRIRCADGSERIWDITRANLDHLPDGRSLHISTAVDVTERHRTDAAMRAAKEEAERANRAKSVFLSRMSHELRTPLNAILGFGQLLELSPLGTQEALSLQYILKGGRHLLSLIDEVLDLSRAETGDLHLTLGEVNVGMLVQECVGLVARLAQARTITCRVTVPREATLWVDEQRLRQMLLNLLSNAIKYNREGGGVLVSSEETAIGQLRLKVSDTGPGISPEGLARLFVPFERLEQEFTEAEGTGLGLVISRRIAEAMGGTLSVQSEVGRGSTFCIELPLALPRAQEASAEAATIAAASPSCALLPTPNAKLLYIEDNVSNLQVIKALLANCRPRWQFQSARNGEEGLVQAQEGSPDLILLDLQLPGMKGDAVLAELRRDPLTQHIPVVLLSADATAPSRERLLASGADDYISKPFKLENLLELLDRTLLKAAVGQRN